MPAICVCVCVCVCRSDVKEDLSILQIRLTGVEDALEEQQNQMSQVLQLLQTIVTNQHQVQAQQAPPLTSAAAATALQPRRTHFPYNVRQPQIEIQDFSPDPPLP